MTHPITVAAVQMQSVPGDKAANMSKARQYIRRAAGEGASIVCLPELFLTGYNLSRDDFLQLSEPPDGQMAESFSALSAELDIFLIAPFPERTGKPGEICNSALVLHEGKVLGVHRKVYLWGSGEKSIFKAGDRFETFPSPWGDIGVLLCADAEYPEPPRHLALKGARMVFVPSVWSIRAKPRWDIFLPAAALSNLYYLIGVNTIGEGVRGGNCGHSKIISPYGEVLAEAPQKEEMLLQATIDLDLVDLAREDLPYLRELRKD